MRSEMSNSRDPLSRGFQLLRWLTSQGRDTVGVREAAAALSVAPSTAHNLLVALVHEGVLQHESATGRYALGLELFRLAHAAIDQVPLRRLSMPYLRQLAEETNEAVHLSVYVRERREVVTVAGVESTHAIRYVVDLYAARPLFVGAAGLAVLAFLPDAERACLLEAQACRAELKKNLAAVRARGYSLTFGTRIQGAVGIAVPIKDCTGAAIGAVGITMPEQRFKRGKVGDLAALLKNCAANLMAEIGGGTPLDSMTFPAAASCGRDGQARGGATQRSSRTR